MPFRHPLLAVSLLFASLAAAQDAEEDKRIFGVIPNNRTTEASLPFHSISARRKLTIAVKDSFAIPLYATTGVYASIYHLEDQNPSFGQGLEGYSKRLAASFADQAIGNMLSEGVVPALTYQDPRYFRIGQGSKLGRAWYAVSRIFVAKMDSGRSTFNFSEWGGNSIAVAVSNAYYPDTRTAGENVEKLVLQCGTDALSNVLKEFWPDVKRHFQHKNGREAAK
jgi:hypothetical protein